MTWIIPIIDKVIRVSFKLIRFDFPNKEIRTSDKRLIKINIEGYFRVVDAQKAVINVSDYMETTVRLITTLAEDICKKYKADKIKKNPQIIGREILKEADMMANGWGIKIEEIFIKAL
jgi:regulator of protease activity HflC (stomatin/prohibitin superfamily)